MHIEHYHPEKELHLEDALFSRLSRWQMAESKHDHLVAELLSLPLWIAVLLFFFKS